MGVQGGRLSGDGAAPVYVVELALLVRVVKWISAALHHGKTLDVIEGADVGRSHVLGRINGGESVNDIHLIGAKVSQFCVGGEFVWFYP